MSETTESTTVTFYLTPLTAPPASTTACLVVVSSSNPRTIGNVIPVEGQVVLGRGRGANIQLDDQSVSRRHVRIERLPNGTYQVADLDSRNGTHLNSVRIAGTAPLKDGDFLQIGNATHVRFSLRERKPAADHLKQALAAAHIGTWSYAIPFRRLLWSEQTDALFGLPLGTLSASPEGLQWVHPEDRERVATELAAAAQGGQNFESEFRLRLPDGRNPWVGCRGEVVQQESGAAPVQLTGTVMDVTERKQQELALRNQALLFESLHDAVVVFDPNGYVLDWNSSAQRMFGWTKEEVLGRATATLLQPRGPDLLAERLENAVKRDGRWQGEVTVTTKNQRSLLCEVVVVPLRDNAGKSIGTVALHRDITERKRMEAQLVLADRLASLGTLAAGVAHEINNPLSFVLSNLAFVQQFLNGPKAAYEEKLGECQQALRETIQGAERIANIVRDLGTASQGTPEEPTAQVDVHEVLKFSLKLSEAQTRHHILVMSDLGPIPVVSGQASKLGQVFLNLLVNAAQAFPEDHPRPKEIRVKTWTNESGQAVVDVADTGTGIPNDLLQRIFDPFFTTKPVGVGTGLGLSICQGIVSGMGGQLTVESTLGVGSTFRVVLPPAGAASSSAAQAAVAQNQNARQAKILVVDDEPLVTNAIRRMLGGTHQVISLRSANEALALLKAGRGFDLILCDLMMPDLTGMDLHARLATELPEAAKKLYFMTGGAFTERARAFVDRNHERVFSKPLDVGALKRLIVDTLDQSQRV